MADTSGLSINVSAVTSELTSGLRNAETAVVSWARGVEDQLKQVEEKTAGVKDMFRSLVEAFFAEKIIRGLADIAMGAAEAADAMEVAANTARNLGHSFDSTSAEKWLDSFATSARGAGLPINELRAGMQTLATVTHSQEQNERALSIAAGLAAARHMDIGTAVSIVSRVLTGHVEILGRYGIATKDAAGNTLTASQMMERLADMGNKAASVVGGSLPGQVGQLANSFSLLENEIGRKLEPAMIAVVDTARDFVDFLRRLSPAAIDAAIAAGSIASGLVAITLALPAARLAIVYVTEAVRLLGVAFAAVDWEMVLALAPIAALGLALYEIGTHTKELTDTFNAAAKSWHDTWQHIVSFIVDRAKEGAEAIDGWNDVFSGRLQQGFGKIGDAAKSSSKAWLGVGESIANAVVSGLEGKDPLDRWLYGAAQRFGAWFRSLGKLVALPGGGGTPNAPFDNAAGGAGGKAARILPDETIKNTIQALQDSISELLERAAAGVESAKNRLDAAKTALDLFKSTLTGGKVSTESEARQEQALITTEMQRQREVGAALLTQREAMAEAAQREAAAAALLRSGEGEIAAHLKSANDRANSLRNNKADTADYQAAVETVRQLASALRESQSGAEHLTSQARSHRLEVEKLGTAYQQTLVSIATLGGDARKVFEELAQSQREALAVLVSGLEEASEVFQRGIRAQEEDIRHREQMSRIGGRTTPITEAIAAAATADAALQAAQENAQTKQGILSTTQATTATTPAELNKAFTDAQDALTQLKSATNAAAEAHAELNLVIKNTTFGFTSFFTTLAAGLAKAVPGLSVNQNTGALLFNWQTALVDAISKTKAFADIQQFVSQVMQVVANVLDSLKPILDILLSILAGVVNAFIDLWNVIARLLDVFGLHIPILQKVTDDFNDLDNAAAPFVSVVHDMPTANELASGSIGTITGKPQNFGSLAAITPDTLNAAIDSPSLGGGLLSKLVEIGGIILGIHALMGLMGNWLNGGSAGSSSLGDTIANVFGLNGAGAGSASASGTGPATDDGSLLTPGGAASGGSKALGNALLGAGVGMAAGSIFGNMEGGGSHTTTGEIGGIGGSLIGGMVGRMLGLGGGPLGSILGGLAGGALGSLFGHADNPALMPDKYNPNYGQAMANFQGSGVNQSAMNVNGQQYSEDSGLSQQLGGMGVVQYLANYIAKTGGAGLSAAMITEFKGLDLSTPIINGKNGVLDLANGFVGSWQQILADANSSLQTIGTQLQSGINGPGAGVMGQLGSSSSRSVSEPFSVQLNISDNTAGGVNIEAISKAQATAQVRMMQSNAYRIDRVAIA